MQFRFKSLVLAVTFIGGFVLGAITLSSSTIRAYYYGSPAGQIDIVASLGNWAGYKFKNDDQLKREFTVWAQQTDKQALELKSDIDYQLAFSHFLFYKIKELEAKFSGKKRVMPNSTFKTYTR